MAVVYANSNSEFYNTYRMYRDYINFKEPLTYSKWMRLPDNFKAACLYVQFYNEITLAWYKVKTQWSIEEEGVECINQYLIKNVEKIKADKKRFTPQYIYKVAYNCLYCVCIDPSKNKDRYYNETSETFETGDDEVSWFDFVGKDFDYDVEFKKDELREFFSNFDDDALNVFVGYALGELDARKAMKHLKDSKYISGNTRKQDYRDAVLSALDDFAKAKLQILIELQFENISEYF